VPSSTVPAQTAVPDVRETAQIALCSIERFRTGRRLVLDPRNRTTTVEQLRV